MIEMSNKIMIVSAKLTLNNSLTPDQISKFSNLYWSVSSESVEIPMFEWLDEGRFMSETDGMRNYIKNLKNKVKGELFVTRKDKDDNIGQGKIKIGSGVTFEPCEFTIMLKKNKDDKPKPLTEEEKILLFREYWETKGVLPAKTEVYKGFKIGQFYAMLVKNGTTLDMLSDILEEANDGK